MALLEYGNGRTRGNAPADTSGGKPMHIYGITLDPMQARLALLALLIIGVYVVLMVRSAFEV